MSKIRNRKLRSIGVESKKDMKIIRKRVLSVVKANRAYVLNDIAFSLGLNDDFIIQSGQ